MEYVAGKSSLQTRDAYLNIENLPEGNYLLFCEVDWLSSTEEQSFVATCYGADSVNFTDKTEQFDKGALLRSTMEGIVAHGAEGLDSQPNDENANIITHTITTDFGYLMTMISNGDGSSTY